VMGDVKDPAKVDQVFARYRPSVVFHAAAYKHVPMMEQENAWAAVQNNSLGTYRIAEAISRYPVQKLVFISTDKAVNPTSVMGASKRLAEMLLQHWARRSQIPTVIVRFGNVLGSTGSVVPKFKEQILRGGPITVTHPDVRRYFMSVPEAGALVLQSGLMGQNGEIFVLDMGEPVKIVDLARDLIRLSGLAEHDIRIEFTGLRPGEKLYEELLTDSEATLPTRHPKVRIAMPVELPGAAWEDEVANWIFKTELVGEIETKAALARFVPAYAPFTGDANVIPLHQAALAG
jgi:FlaA1/EpsC-like NDP-sugar epimerase